MLPAIYQSNFHPTAFFFFIGKNKRETDMTLIRRMHSLGRGEGRAGLLSHSKYMHGLQDGTGLGSRCEEALHRWQGARGGASSLCSSPYVTRPVGT